MVANAADAAWRQAGCPDPWVVVDAGGGTGALAAAVLAAAPACAPTLRYVVVERSAALRAAAAARLPVEAPAQLLVPRAGIGPLVTVIAELPHGPLDGVILANELLDNLPFDVYERTGGGWSEIRVVVDSDALGEVAVPADPGVAEHLDRLAPEATGGSRVPWQAAAAEWLRAARNVLRRGRVVVIDYGRPTSALAGAGGWLRTYRSGGPGGPPLERLGEQDITADVAFDQLALVARPTTLEDQAAWLERHGLAELVQAAGTQWRETAAAGDLAALVARSRLGEARALTDRGGLGGFTAAEWEVRER